MLTRILDDSRQALLQEERRLLGDVRVALVRLQAPAESQKALVRSFAQLDEMFLLVVVGEFNAGKSAVINALVGDRILEEGPTPTTSRIGLLKHGEEAGRSTAGASTEVITLPVELLRELTIVDTPGTNAVIREHEALTREFVPRSDLVLFVTSADRPFTESERAFLETIQSWGKKVVVAVNKVDILETPDDAARVIGFVKEKAQVLLGIRPQVFAVSARQARRAKAESNQALLHASGFLALEGFLTRTLHETVRVRLKLLNPLGVGQRVLEEAEGAAGERLTVLQADFATLDQVEGVLDRHRQDLARDTRARVAEVEKAISEVEKRGSEVFAEKLRITRIGELMAAERTRAEIEGEVLGDVVRVVEGCMDEAAAVLASSEGAQLQAIVQLLKGRQAVHGDRVVGPAVQALEDEPTRPPSEVRREALRVLEAHDLRPVAVRIAGLARHAAVAAALAQIAAVLLLGAVLALAATAASQVVGILAAAALSFVGVLLLPLARARAGDGLGEAVGALREALASRLKVGFDREVGRGRQRALAAIEPFSRFVRSEGDRIRAQREELAGLRSRLASLKSRIESTRGPDPGV
ncbi:MAG TPA: dynamin family protein [Vicinamibacteria bacterium]|nr:dynamin family protein [Vicinamibacteria bacterium]